jgi:hypothetical protein
LLQMTQNEKEDKNMDLIIKYTFWNTIRNSLYAPFSLITLIIIK